MKFIIGFLFVVQLVMGGILSLNSLSAYYQNQLLQPYGIQVSITFEDMAQYEKFLTFLEERQIEVSRRIFTHFDRIDFYSTDPTFAGLLSLREGYFPMEGRQFISNLSHENDNQVGLVRNLWPDITVMIRYLHQPEHHLDYPATFDISGTYFVHTVDFDLIAEIDLFLEEYAFYHTILLLPDPIDGRFGLDFLMMGINWALTPTARSLMMLIPIITFICLITSLIQYSMNQMKKSFILLVHGFSKHDVLKKSMIEISTVFLITGIISYIGLIIYLIIGDFGAFFLQVTAYFMLIYAVLMLIYLSITFFVLVVILNAFRSPTTIKGFKPDAFIQLLNHGLKIVFTASFLITGHFLINHINNLQTQLSGLVHWEVAQGVYRIPYSHFPSTQELFEDQARRSVQFYERLSVEHHAFIMNSDWVWVYDNLGRTLSGSYFTDLIPFHINPYGNRVDISLNYLELNPIETVSGQSIEELVIWDSSVLNLLVPEHLASYEDDIITNYLWIFYYGEVILIDWDYDYLELSELSRTKDDLSINVIYVKSGQYYFSFNPYTRPDSGNRIKDPIAVIFYTGTRYDSNASATFTTSLYFVTDSPDPYSVIAPLLEEYDLTYAIRFVYSVFDHHGEILAELREDIARSLLLMGGLLLTNVIVSYNLIANYFWRHKYVLFTKKLFGYNLFKRHQWFILSFLGYLIPLIVVVSLLYGLNVLLIGILTLVAELITMLIFEHRLMKKSFAEIMKGER